jgi:hypothetical protein
MGCALCGGAYITFVGRIVLRRLYGCYIVGELDKLLADAAEKIRREAYSAGWRDAVATVTKALAEGQPGDDTLPPSFDAGKDFEGTGRREESNSNLPTIGTTPHYVYQAVRKRPGMTGSEVIAQVHAEGHTVAEAQIRTALSRLDKRTLIVNRHKKWFPR